jgi:DNA-binding SARP family transcriptional activator
MKHRAPFVDSETTPRPLSTHLAYRTTGGEGKNDQGGVAPDRLASDQAKWDLSCELLNAGQYEEVAQLLDQAATASEPIGDVGLVQILAAAHRICLALGQCRAEVEWHRQAFRQADQREDELRQQLHAILNLLSSWDALSTGLRSGAYNVSVVELTLPEHVSVESVTRPGLWQQIQGLLGRSPRSPSPERAASEGFPQRRAPPSPVRDENSAPTLTVYCLGPFRVYQDDQLISDWPSGKGKCIFKYMIANSGRPIPKEVLMDLFWGDAGPDAARNNLNVAIYGLRQAFRATRPDFSHILFEDDRYLLNPAMPVWIDAEEFLRHFETGQILERKHKLARAMREYEIAEGLYQGDFLEEDLYQDWPMLQRESLRNSHISILDRSSRYYLKEKSYATCIHLCQKMLGEDNCREEVHRRLMRCYSRQGQRNLALRQYHLCVEKLQQELGVPPTDATVALYHRIRNGETI